MSKPELDPKILMKFVKYLKEFDDDGGVHIDPKFLKCFPSRRKQAAEFIQRTITEVVVPYAREFATKEEATDEQEDA